MWVLHISLKLLSLKIACSDQLYYWQQCLAILGSSGFDWCLLVRGALQLSCLKVDLLHRFSVFCSQELMDTPYPQTEKLINH